MALRRSKANRGKPHPYSRLGDAITFDGERELGVTTCRSCDASHPTAQGFLLRNNAKFAAYLVSWNPHASEKWIDMSIGSFEDPDYPDQALFACRIGPVELSGEDACTLVTPTWGGEHPPEILGTRLNRDAALAHHWLPDFWNAVDWLVFNEEYFL